MRQRPEANPDVERNQRTTQTARVEIDLNDLPIRQEGLHEQYPVMDQQPENALRTPVSL